MLHALVVLLGLQLLGEATVRLLGLPVPGPVLGMALLWGLLMARPSTLPTLKPTAQGFLQHLSLLFVPAGVGVMLHIHRLGDEATAIAVALVVSTLIGMAVTAWTVHALMGRLAPDQDAPP